MNQRTTNPAAVSQEMSNPAASGQTQTNPPAHDQTDTKSPRINVYHMNTYYEQTFASDVKAFQENGRLKSGYANLDAITNLYPGLYVIGAISSLGKTTFVHQMCEQMAEAGSHILFFSLEQSVLELASKSISRSIAKENYEKGLTSLQVRRSDPSDPRIQSAISRSMGYADRIHVVECSFRATIDSITRAVGSYIRQRGIKPVVVIDYLQVIQADPGLHMTTKDLVDYHVRRLKELQSDRQLTVIVVSSLNRQNYMTAIDFESFKESGGIEYTADVLWGLQLQCIHDDIFSKPNKINEKREQIMQAKREIPRKIELVCLKNRFGISSYTCRFEYYPNFDWFREDLSGIDLKDMPAENADTDGFITLPDGFQDLPFK